MWFLHRVSKGLILPLRLLIEYDGGNEFHETTYLGVAVPG